MSVDERSSAPPVPAVHRNFSSLSFVAGLISGAAGQAVGHPLDTLKVHAQAAKSAEHLHLVSLWRGAAAPIATVGAVNSLALGIFENVRRMLWPHDGPTPLPCLAAAGSMCGLSVSLITCPLSRVKVIQQLTGGVSFVDAVKHCLESRTLYRAYPTAALWECTRGSYVREQDSDRSPFPSTKLEPTTDRGSVLLSVLPSNLHTLSDGDLRQPQEHHREISRASRHC